MKNRNKSAGRRLRPEGEDPRAEQTAPLAPEEAAPDGGAVDRELTEEETAAAQTLTETDMDELLEAAFGEEPEEEEEPETAGRLSRLKETPSLLKRRMRVFRRLLRPIWREEVKSARRRTVKLRLQMRRHPLKNVEKPVVAQIFRMRFTYQELNVLLLAICPLVGGTVSLPGAFALSVILLLALVFSSLFIELFQRILPGGVGEICHMVVIVGLVTAINMVLQVFMPVLDASLGLYVPLVTITCIILDFLLESSRKQGFFYLAADSAATGGSAALLLLILGLVREVLGRGTLCGAPLWGNVRPFLLAGTVGGGFLALGFLAAVIQGLRGLRKKGKV